MKIFFGLILFATQLTHFVHLISSVNLFSFLSHHLYISAISNYYLVLEKVLYVEHHYNRV